MLEYELSVMEQERDKLEGLVEGMEARMGEVTNTAGLKAMLEHAGAGEYHQSQYQIQNKVVSQSCCILFQ